MEEKTVSKTKRIEELTIQDIFDMDFLQQFQDNFALSVGMTSITVDINGAPVTRPSRFTDFCMKYTRASEIGNKRCMECDRKGGEESARTGRPAVYECHAGLMDFGVPIIVEGRQIGSVLGGQVLTEPADEAKFRRIAAEINVDPDEYIAAVQKVDYLPRERLEAAAQVLYLMTATFSRMGYYQYKLKSIAETISESLGQVSATMEELAASATNVDENQHRLNDEIKNVNKISEQIDEVINLIKDIADQTRLLGLNASIEAARAGVAGAGFSVVAEEIRKLSDESKATTEKIRKFTLLINQSVNKTVSKGEETSTIVGQQTKAIETVANDLYNLSEVAEQLYKLSHDQK